MAEDFHANAALHNDWKITAMSSSLKHSNVEFIATMEHRQYPIFGVQFHPEVIPYEWATPSKYPRTERIISANQYFYETVVHYARKNDHSFLSAKNNEDENDLLIYNYPVYYTRFNTASTGNRRQIYLF